MEKLKDYFKNSARMLLQEQSALISVFSQIQQRERQLNVLRAKPRRSLSVPLGTRMGDDQAYSILPRQKPALVAPYFMIHVKRSQKSFLWNPGGQGVKSSHV